MTNDEFFAGITAKYATAKEEGNREALGVLGKLINLWPKLTRQEKRAYRRDYDRRLAKAARRAAKQ